MTTPTINEVIGNTDIYLVDQILKGRYERQDRILDAGCGHGRNMHWFLRNGMEIYGIDQDALVIEDLKSDLKGGLTNRLVVGRVDKMPFQDVFFDHVISSAVLHFAENTEHFLGMMDEMVRVLKPGGSLFIRMTSDIGIEDKVVPMGNGVFLVPDGSTRFLLTRDLLKIIAAKHHLSFLEPFKTVNVNDARVMCTIVFQKDH